MARLNLTAKWLHADQESGIYSDVLVPSLKVRVAKSGKKTFSVVAWKNGRTVRKSFGKFPEVTLAEARRRADAFSSGPEPEDNTQSSPQPETRSDVGTDLPVTALFEDYVARMRSRGQPAANTYADSFWRGSRSFVNFLTERHGRLPRASEITPDDAASWLRERRKTAPFYPYYLRGQLHAAFSWGLKQRHDWTGEGRDYGLTHNPIASVPAGQKEPPCDRVLSLEELKACWDNLNPSSSAHRVLQLIIAMGGLRVTEVAHTEADWWGGDHWLRIPETKNGRPHAVPLTEIAKPCLTVSQAITGRGAKWLFPNEKFPVEPITLNGIRQSVRRLYTKLDMDPFNPRDLRRTLKTHLIDRQVDERWLEIWHNHGQTAGVARKHYTRAEHHDVKVETAAEIDRFLRDVLGA